MQTKKIVLDGNSLHMADIVALVSDPDVTVEITDHARSKVKKSQDFLLRELNGKIIYGINTGFGPMASYIIGPEHLVELQYNLIRSHAVGIGNPIRSEYVLAAMLVRLNTLAKGYSGVSPELLEQLCFFINHRIIPIVPEHGAVGTSGDLVQLAHIALALIGEGEVIYQGKRRAAKDVLSELTIKPHALNIKEGLALINGTSVMTGIGAVIIAESERLLSVATHFGALALELVHGFKDGISEGLHAFRPHHGQITIARSMRELLASSQLLRSRKIFIGKEQINGDVNQIPEDVQEIYSLRCIPQILGPVLDTLLCAKKVIETEINAVTDNPIIDAEHEHFLHGGNFHGDYIAAAIDQLKMTLVKLTLLSERQTNFFLNRKVNRHFPPFLNLNKPGLALGLQGLQFVATSTAAQSQTLAFPQYVHSISTNGDNQDIVSMGTDAALLTAKVIDNAFVVLAVELVTLAQAVDYLAEEEKLSQSSKKLYEDLRAILPVIREDRVITAELQKIVGFLRINKQFLVKHE